MTPTAINGFFEATLRSLIEEAVARGIDRVERAPTRRLLSVTEAAAYLGRTPEAVRHLVAHGKIRRVGADKRVQLDIRDLDHWIESHKE
jgi:excisionase family DNA binding protein